MDLWNPGGTSRLVVPALAILTSAAVGAWFRRYRSAKINPILWKIIAVGLFAARGAFVVQHFDRYATAPLTMLDFSDGGFAPMAGMFAAFVLGAELTRKSALPGRPLLIATLAGAAVWVAGLVATLDFAPARMTVPAVELRRLDGSPVQLRSLSAQPMVVNLWATWCPPCQREMPVLRDAQRANPDITFVFVNQGESSATIRGYLADEGLDINNVFADPVGELAEKASAFAFPTTLFFDRHGTLFMRQVGGLTKATLEERLKLLRAAGGR